MKKSLVIALMMVLALSVSAFAAEIKTSGKVFYTWTSNADVFDNGYRVQMDGKLDDASGFQIRFEGSGLLKRANYWLATPVGKVVVGKQYTNISAVDIFDTELDEGYTGISVTPSLGEGLAATAFVAPVANGTGHHFGVQGSYDLKVAKVYGGFDKTGEADMNWTAGATAPFGETLSAYAEVNKTGDADAVTLLGGEVKVAGFDTYVEYVLGDNSKFGVDVYKTVKNVELNYKFTKDEGADAVHYFGTTLYF